MRGKMSPPTAAFADASRSISMPGVTRSTVTQSRARVPAIALRKLNVSGVLVAHNTSSGSFSQQLLAYSYLYKACLRYQVGTAADGFRDGAPAPTAVTAGANANQQHPRV